ncbi:uncharacterized protein LOC135717599 [Ochlerotatus camptorhynchus]|uniref:uncharacterized protein LOC135717599 n=1 Tax=Ochlerotatus camptorhynchus TaxID=644619 RepID=UPI0031DFCB16
MKDPLLTRNGPVNFIQPAQQQGTVMMVDGLDSNTANTDKLFNLFFLYGNVILISRTYTLPNNSISFKVYSTTKNNHFPGQQKSHSPLLQYPTRMPSEDLLLTAFTTKDCHPSQVRMFPLKSESFSSELVEFPSVALAVNAIM